MSTADILHAWYHRWVRIQSTGDPINHTILPVMPVLLCEENQRLVAVRVVRCIDQ